jgi:indole-3-glycerol phosphate synthase
MSVLKQIFEKKISSTERKKKLKSITQLEKEIANNLIPSHNFFKVLNNNNDQIKIIAECKKSSPSAGLIVDRYDPLAICNKYQTKGYKNLSILTEEEFFHGSIADLTKVKKELNMPILQKDFIYDEWQLFEAKSCGADCILLISEYLNFEQLKSLINTAESLQIDVLVEFHRLEELGKIINLNIKNIGINNRNLMSLETNVSHCLDVYKKNKSLLKDYNIIAESGFSSSDDINKYYDYGIERFLIGEHLLKESF